MSPYILKSIPVWTLIRVNPFQLYPWIRALNWPVTYQFLQCHRPWLISQVGRARLLQVNRLRLCDKLVRKAGSSGSPAPSRVRMPVSCRVIQQMLFLSSAVPLSWLRGTHPTGVSWANTDSVPVSGILYQTPQVLVLQKDCLLYNVCNHYEYLWGTWHLCRPAVVAGTKL